LRARLGLDACFASSEFSGDPALGGAFQVTFHDEVGFVDFLQGVGFFPDGDSERMDSNGTATEFHHEGFEDALVHFIQAILIDLEHREGFVGDGLGDLAIRSDLGVIAHASQQVVGDAGGAAAAPRDFTRAVLIELDIEQAG
jgi:hypothetical protein